MNPEAIAQRQAVRDAKQKYSAGQIDEAALNEVVDAYIDWMYDRQKKLFPKRKAKRFSRNYVMRAI